MRDEAEGLGDQDRVESMIGFVWQRHRDGSGIQMGSRLDGRANRRILGWAWGRVWFCTFCDIAEQ